MTIITRLPWPQSFLLMKTLYIVSVDLAGSGCDELLADLQAAKDKEKEFIKHMVGNGLSGYVTTCSVEVADDDYLYYLENPTAFFDTDDNGTRKQLSRQNFR